ncbi:hypothetical protein NCAS_0D03090 [Naumovozyma castellii]|uniref:Matrin-type domain-containing protein n=1 Tax=Naumovozyma castellii TaxID=27288 RepID=G0VE99_NAUCA|nr:hypothetical protein NCAS_0D03090 [Naumovozyma castellii CBS 4309]CCC69890.1 hypothetical protein NCAS_0D03090 [Naumovozyma castellii CBS 4309]
MARYYCEYCHSYLTHDTLSVRKSHLIGKNHLRITADYYRNKNVNNKVKVKSHKKKAPKNTSEGRGEKKLKVKCVSNKEKKKNEKLKKIFQKELQTSDISSSILSKVYEGSPGYSKIFIDSNRLDIGDSVKLNKLPQRANDRSGGRYGHQQDHERSKSGRTRYETFDLAEYYSNRATRKPLEPPKILSAWSGTVPKTSIYHEKTANSLLQHTINESKRRIMSNSSVSGKTAESMHPPVKRRRYGN